MTDCEMAKMKVGILAAHFKIFGNEACTAQL
jgi:hypothetical protein